MAQIWGVDLLSYKMLIFRLIVTYFGTLRMHQIAPFFPNPLAQVCNNKIFY